MLIKETHDKSEKTAVSLAIMHSIPKWFSPPEDIEKKAVIHREFPFFTAYDNGAPVGFLTLKLQNAWTADVFNMGILETHHRQGIGSKLMGAAENFCISNQFEYLTVKTLDESADYEPYEQTRNFYHKMGFIPLEVFTTFWDEENPCLFLVKHLTCEKYVPGGRGRPCVCPRQGI